MTDFPTIVYRVPGPHRGPRGTTYAYLGVDDKTALAAAKAAGWHETLDAAIGGGVIREVTEAKAAVSEIDPKTREELEAQAKKLGVSFNARTRDEVLAERIAEAAQ